jgi:hypothetical protein
MNNVAERFDQLCEEFTASSIRKSGGKTKAEIVGRRHVYQIKYSYVGSGELIHYGMCLGKTKVGVMIFILNHFKQWGDASERADAGGSNSTGK